MPGSANIFPRGIGSLGNRLISRHRRTRLLLWMSLRKTCAPRVGSARRHRSILAGGIAGRRRFLRPSHPRTFPLCIGTAQLRRLWPDGRRCIFAGMNSAMKPRVAIVFTGGTISMRLDPTAGGAVPMLSGEEILAQVPGLEQIAQVVTTDFARLPGPHITPSRMLELSRVIASQLADERANGVVVTHGTDTLEETAYLLDLVLPSDQPVVLVGAMRNSSELGWDGPANLRSAVRVAADPVVRGLSVLVVMNNQLLVASDATNTDTDALDSFQSRVFGSLGYVD